MNQTSVLALAAFGLFMSAAVTALGTAVEEGVFFDSSTGNYTVRYIAPEDDEPETVIEGTFYPSTKIDPVLTSGLKLNADGRVSYSYVVTSSLTSQQPLIGLGVPCAGYLVLEKPKDPAGWRATINPSNQVPQTYNLQWGYRNLTESSLIGPRTKGLSPGQEQAGFGFVSVQLPGVGSACLDGNAPLPTFSDQWLDSKSKVAAELDRLEKNDHVVRFAAIPTVEVPDPFNCPLLLERIRDHIKPWPTQQLMESVFNAKMVGLLDNAIAACKNPGPAMSQANAIKALNEIRAELRKKYPGLEAEGTGPTKNQTLAEHDQRLAARVLDFNVTYVFNRLAGK